jgi:hypothetical protein
MKILKNGHQLYNYNKKNELLFLFKINCYMKIIDYLIKIIIILLYLIIIFTIIGIIIIKITCFNNKNNLFICLRF